MDVFGSSGVRGVVNEGMTPGFAIQIAQAAGAVWEHSTAAIARDPRTSGPMLTNAVASGLQSVGTDIERLGVVPTPAAQQYAATAGVPTVIITASHNPPQFNGIKLIGADGVSLPIATLERIERVFLEDAVEPATWEDVGCDGRVADYGMEYVDAVVAEVDQELIADASLTVAVDPGHGAGCETTPALLRNLGCRVVTVNAQMDGNFPGREPEPVPERLTDCCRLVQTTDADLGIAHDGDADRAVFIDEQGEPIDASASLAALFGAELGPGDVAVSAVNVSQRVVDAVAETGADLDLTPIGATHIAQRIRDLVDSGESVPIAGEGNGGVFYPPYRICRDGGYTAARFLELVAERVAAGEAASDIVAPYAGYHKERRNVGYDTEDQRERMLKRAAEWARAQSGELDTKDGYRVDFGDAWVLVRPSGTEPLIRTYAEAGDEKRVDTLLDSVVSVMQVDV